MKKLCFFTGSLKQGGVERDISILANYFCNKGYSVSIACIFSQECFFKIDSKIKLINLSQNFNRKSIFSIFALIKRIRKLQVIEKFDVINCNMIGLNMLLLVALRKFDCKKTIRIASDPKSWPYYKFILAKKIYPIADLIITQTKYQGLCFGKKILSKSAIIPNICDYDCIKKIDTYDSKNIVFIGRMNNKVKRIDLLIKGFSIFHQKHSEFKLNLFGEFNNAESEKIIKKTIFENNLNDCVFIKGSTNNVFKEFDESFCYIFASPHEGMPNSLLEAQLYGLPVITSKFNGVEEIINNGFDGLIYEFGNCLEMANKLELILKDLCLYERISKNGILQKNNYSFKKLIGKWEDVFNI